MPTTASKPTTADSNTDYEPIRGLRTDRTAQVIVSGNGQRHYGAYDADSLTTAVKIARARANIA